MRSIDPLRVRRIVVKELRQIFRDWRLKRIIFVAPVVQLIVFGYAVNTDIRRTALFLVDHDATRQSRELVAALTASDYFRVVGASQRPAELLRALDRGDAIVGLEIPAGFAADLAAGTARVQLLTDGTNSNTATIAQANALRIIQRHAQRLLERQRAVDLRVRAWFNPDLSSRVYNVPAVIGVIIMLMALLLTALTIVREREFGTLEQLSVTPLRPVEFILGKTLPVALIALADLAIITTVAVLWFGVPFRGNPLVLLLAALVYILAGLSFGLLLSTVSRTQQEALMGMFLFFMPAIILSGFMFPVFTMPAFFRWLTALNPLTHFLEIVRPVFLKGVGLEVLWPQLAALLVMAAAGMVTAVWRLRRGD